VHFLYCLQQKASSYQFNNLGEIRGKLITAGIHYLTVQAKGPDGNTYSDTLAISVLPSTDVDTLLRAKWSVFVNALKNKDIVTALSMIHPRSRERYQIIFDVLKDQLPTIMTTYTGLNIQSIKEGRAYYELYTTENNEEFTYTLSFIKDDSGIWLIGEF